jgi:hypothetical protein
MIWGCRIDEHSNLLAGYAWPSDTPSGRIRPASELTRNMRVRLGASETATFSGRILLFGMTSAGVALSQSAAPPFADTFQVDGLVAQPRRFSRDDLLALSTWAMPVVFAESQQVQTSTFSGPVAARWHSGGGRTRSGSVSQPRSTAQVRCSQRRGRVRRRPWHGARSIPTTHASLSLSRTT